MAKTPHVALRLDPDLYAPVKELVRSQGSTVTAEFERYMSERLGQPSERVRTTGLNTRERAMYGLTKDAEGLKA